MEKAAQSNFNFQGIHLRTHKTRLKNDTFQIDRNGSRYQERTWRVRQGMSRASVTAQAVPISGTFSFAGTDYAIRFITVFGSSIDGEANPIPHWDEGLTGIGSSVYTVS